MPTPRPNNPAAYRDLARAIRCHCLQMTHRGKSGHVGSMLSMADLLAVLYTRILNVDPANPAILKQVRNTVARFKGKMAIGFLGEETFAVQQYLRGGLEQLMIDYAMDEELPKRIAGVAADYYCELYRNVIREGVEVIVLGDDYAGKSGPFMSPAHFASNAELAQGAKIFTRGKGCYVWDIDGKRYFYSFATLLTTVCGHNRPEVTRAVKEQMERLEFFPNYVDAFTVPLIELARKLAEIMPGDLSVSFFVNSGSEANETAMKMARQYHLERGRDDAEDCRSVP